MPKTKTTMAAAVFAAALGIGLAGAPGQSLAQSQGWSVPQAQPPAPPTDVDIVAMIGAGMAHLYAQDFEAAYAEFSAANDLTFGSSAFALSTVHLPNLALARYYFALEDWDQVAYFAASVASGLDVDGYRDHPTRIEATAFQGVVAYLNDRLNEADLLLRAALAASSARGDMPITQDVAHAYLAATTFQSSAPDAVEILDAYLDAPVVENSWIEPDLVVFLVYVRVFSAYRDGQDPAELAEIFGEYLETIPDTAQVTPDMMSFYRGFLGLLQGESQNFAAARDTLQARHDFLTANGLIDNDYLRNVQRLAMTLHNLGDTPGAIAFLRENQEVLRNVGGIDGEMFMLVEQDLGLFHAALGDHAKGQAHLRAAYEIIRRTRERNDAQVLALRPLIDQTEPGFDDFAFADELRLLEADFKLSDDGTSLLTDFFAGRYLTVEWGLSALAEGPAAATPQYLMNQALYLGLSGYRDDAIETLAILRDQHPNNTLDPALPLLIELVATVWVPNFSVPRATLILKKLAALDSPIRPDMAMAIAAMQAYLAFADDDVASVVLALERWPTVPRPDAPTPWSLFAQAAMLEVATSLAGPDIRAQLRDAFEHDIQTRPDLSVLYAYGRLAVLGNSAESELGPDVIVELNAMRRRVRDGLPVFHTVVAFSEFAISLAHQRVGDFESAIEWMDRATTTVRLHPAPNTDTIAFVMSEQARMLLQLQRTDQAALIARQAFDMIDPLQSRPGLVSAVVENYAKAVAARVGDQNAAVQVFAPLVDDPAYLNRMAPFNRYQQLLAYADAIKASDGDWEKVSDLLDQAEAALGEINYELLAPLSNLAWFRATAQYFYDVGDVGYAQMELSNRRLDRLLAQERDTGGAMVERSAEFRARASWTASIAWEFAETLPR